MKRSTFRHVAALLALALAFLFAGHRASPLFAPPALEVHPALATPSQPMGTAPLAPTSFRSMLSASSGTKAARYVSSQVVDLAAESITGVTSGDGVGTNWISTDPSTLASTAGTATYASAGWPSDGGPAVSFSSGIVAIDTAASSLSGDWSFAALLRPTVVSSAYTIFSASNTPGSSYLQAYIFAGQLGVQIVGTTSGSGLRTSTIPIRTTEDTLVLFSFNASTQVVTVWANGQKATLSGTAAVGFQVPTKATVGSLWNGSYGNGFSGVLRRFGLWSRQFTDADWRTIAELWGLAHPGTGGPYRWTLAIVGNSIPAGWNGSAAVYPLSGLLAMPANVTVINGTHPGYTSELLAGTIPGDVLTPAAAQPTMPLVVLMFGELRNSIFSDNDTASQAAAAYFANCDTIHNAGKALGVAYYVIASTAPDCQGWGGGSGSQAVLQSANAIVRANWRAHADAFVDLVNVAPFSNAANTTFYLGDEVHFTQQGEQLAAQVFGGQIRGVAGSSVDGLLLTQIMVPPQLLTALLALFRRIRRGSAGAANDNAVAEREAA